MPYEGMQSPDEEEMGLNESKNATYDPGFKLAGKEGLDEGFDLNKQKYQPKKEAAAAGLKGPEPKPLADKDANGTPIEKKPLTKIDTKIVIADTSESIGQHARDVAESRLTENPSEFKGIGGFIRKVWKHNLFRPYYRAKEIARVKSEITTGGDEGNIFAGEVADKNDTTAHQQAMDSIVDRYASEYDNMVHTEAGETKETLVDPTARNLVIDLVKKYAAMPTPDRAAFVEEKKTTLAQVRGLVPGVLAQGDLYADNIWRIIEQVHANIEAGKSLEELDLNFEIYVGKAKEGVRTEAQYNAVDRITEKIMHSKVGCFLNEATVASAVAIASTLTVGLAKSALNSQIAKFATFGATTLVSALIGGARESVKIEDDRRQHFRERAQGKAFNPDQAPRRVELEKLRYQTETAQSLTSALDLVANYESGVTPVTQAEFNSALAALAEAEARVKLSDRRTLDLISFSDIKNVDVERTALDMSIHKAKVGMQQILTDMGGAITMPGGADFDTFTQAEANTRIDCLTGNEIEDKNRRFKKVKIKHVANAIVKGFLTGLVVGGAIQEGAAFFNPGQEGLIEHGFNALTVHKPEIGSVTSFTPLEALRHWFAGDSQSVAAAMPAPDLHSHMVDLGANHFKLPEGVELTQGAHGAYELTQGHNVLVGGLLFDQHGHLTPESLQVLHDKGVSMAEKSAAITKQVTEHVNMDAKDYVNAHAKDMTEIRRHMWFDNNTNYENVPHGVNPYDKNELGLHWGGDHGTDGHGNYVMSVKSMLPEGSYHGDASANPMELMKTGHLKLLLSVSRGTEHQVFEVPVDKHGNVFIDGNTPAGALYHMDPSGHAIYDGKFAEIAQSMGTEKDGAEGVRILATHIGRGAKTIGDNITHPVTGDETQIYFNMPLVGDHLAAPAGAEPPVIWPPVIPFPPRTPLERTHGIQPPIPKPKPEPKPEPVIIPPVPEPIVIPPIPEPKPEPKPGPKPLPEPVLPLPIEYKPKKMIEDQSKPMKEIEDQSKEMLAIEDHSLKALTYDKELALKNIALNKDQAKRIENADISFAKLEKALEDDLLKNWEASEKNKTGINYEKIIQEALHNSDQFEDGTEQMADYLTARIIKGWDATDNFGRRKAGEAADIKYENDPAQIEWAKAHGKLLASIVRTINRLNETHRAEVMGNVFDFVESNQEQILNEAEHPTSDPKEIQEDEVEDGELKEKKVGVFQDWMKRFRKSISNRRKDQKGYKAEDQRIKDLNNAQAKEAQRKIDEDAAKTAEAARIRAQEAADQAKGEKTEETTEPVAEAPEFEWNDEQEARLEAGTLTPEELKAYLDNERTKSPEELKDKYEISLAAKNGKNPNQLALLRDLPIRKLFGLPRNFTYEEFKPAWRRLVGMTNPAANNDSASNNELFLAIQEYKNLVTPIMQPAV